MLLGHAHLRPHSLDGLYEKIFLGMELAWLFVAAIWIAAGQVAELPPRRPQRTLR